MPLQRKEVGVDLSGVNGLNPFKQHDSAARQAMTATQLGQAPIVEDNEPRYLTTGLDLEYAESTFDIKFPVHCTVLKIVPKYATGIGRDSIRHNPVTTVIYEDYYDPYKTVGIINVPEFFSLHQDFGFRFKRNAEVWERLAPNQQFAEGERLAGSPAVKADGRYGYGLEAEVAFMSLPGTIEDGFVVSESFMKRTTPTSYNTQAANWGRRSFPLNLYGTDEIYKPFPDIGERIRDDGLIYAFRDIDDDLAVAEMTPRALREVDVINDRPLYGKPGALVVDITVYHDEKLNPNFTPTGMEEQARKYYEAQCHYYRTLLDEYNRLKKRRGAGLKITPEFNQLLKEAQLFLPVPSDRRKLSRTYRLETLDEWRVEITYEHKLEMGMGNKKSDLSGGIDLIN